MITLYQFEISPFCDKIRRVLHWKRQPYQVREVSMWEALIRLKKINPIGKLPCLEHHGDFVADSTDIAHYLEERYPEPPLLPEDPAQRAWCHVLEDWADESLYFYEMRLRFTFSRNAERWVPALTARDSFAIRALAPVVFPRLISGVAKRQGVGRKPEEMVLRDVQRHLEAVTELLGGGEWLVGGALTLADIAVFAQLDCIRGTEEGARHIDQRGALGAWMERVDRATAAPESGNG